MSASGGGADAPKKGRIGTIVRRTFLVGSTAVAGGVAFGYYFATKAVPNPLLDGLGEGEAAITPFIKIDGEGITFITPRADSGQGVYSLQAHMIAEELDVDPQTVRIDPGLPHQAYYNGVLGGAGLPFPEFVQSWSAETMRDAMQVAAKLLGLQVTGGSTTTPDMFDKLREAGAVARETLKLAASKKTGTPVAQLKTDNGAVVLPDGKRLTYVELAADAAKLRPVSDVALRPPERWKYLGKQMRRTDIVAKSTGTQQYGIDVRFEGMLFATVRTNPGIGGPMKRYDARKAEKMRGVKKIAPISNGVAIIADNTWRAFKAADVVEVEWGPGPYPATSAELWALHAAAIDTGPVDGTPRDDGDVEAAQQGATVVEAEYRAPYLAHAPMEPMNATVLVREGQVDIWTGTQVPAFMRDRAAKVAGVDPSSVYVHAQPMGGSFGRRLELEYALQAVEVAMLMKGTPVKMTWSREEDMSHDFPRPMQLARFKGTVKDGRVDSLDMQTAGKSPTRDSASRWGITAPPGPDIWIANGSWDQPFGIPNLRVRAYDVPNGVSISSWRAPGANSNAFFFQAFLDELIVAAGADPLQERLRLCSDPVSKQVLEAVGALASWKGPKLGPKQGRGLAFAHSHGVPVAEVVDVTDTDAGIRIDRVYVALDVQRVLDPVNFENQVMGAINFGLGHAINCELTYDDYKPVQTNYYAYEAMRLYQAPEISVKVLSNNPKLRGVGEPSLPPAAPALAGAIFAATGKRLREMPFNKHVKFV